MTATVTTDSFRHEALLYEGPDGFVAGTAPFVAEGVAAGEPTLVVVSGGKIAMLRDELGDAAEQVYFADMADVGLNPARIIPAWRDFVDRHSDAGRLRGIGEPIWAGRSAEELTECQRHESLLNLVFGECRPWWLVCPYDTAVLPGDVIDEAHRSHPFVLAGGVHRPSTTYRDDDVRPFEGALPDPPAHARQQAFDQGALEDLRAFVARSALGAGLALTRASDLVLAVNELATNSLRYGGGGGTLLFWDDAGRVVCEVRDGGRLDQPLVGREQPTPEQIGGRGLWLVNQLCDLVQIRSFTSGTAVRVHMLHR